VKQTFKLRLTKRFTDQAAKLPDKVLDQLEKRLEQLQAEPKYPSLGTHPVEGAVGDFGDKVFELYVNMKYRATWEYGPKKGEITLRNIDNHNDCLKKP
jgi:hypothetical protein